MKIDPNGMAFPLNYNNGHHLAMVDTGLTIRAELAARAMQGILSYGQSTSSNLSTSKSPDDIAHYAVMCADALIAELNK